MLVVVAQLEMSHWVDLLNSIGGGHCVLNIAVLLLCDRNL